MHLHAESVRQEYIQYINISLSAVFILNGELTLLTSKQQRICWRIEQNYLTRVKFLSRQFCSYHPPLIGGNAVYIANGAKVQRWTQEA